MTFGTLVQKSQVFLIALVLCLGLQAYLAITKEVPTATGELFGNDGYMRLVRVTALNATGDWTDTTIIRDNAPYGTVLHWTRPLDVLLLAGAKVLEPIMGFRSALYWWGAAISPILHLVLIFSLLWAVAPLYADSVRRLLLVLAVLMHPLLVGLALFGRPDHHTLVMLTFVLMLGYLLRLVSGPASPRLALLTGAAAGFGVWLTVELLLGVIFLYGVLSLLWLAGRDQMARWAAWLSLGLVAMIALAVVLEHPPDHLFQPEYDRISVVQLLAVGLLLGFWAPVSRLERAVPFLSQATGRFAALALYGIAALGVTYVIYPDFLAWPAFGSDPFVMEAYLGRISELQPVWPSNQAELWKFLGYFGNSIFVLPYVVYLAASKRDEQTRVGWFVILIGILLFLPIGVISYRFTDYSIILLLIGLADLVGRATVALGQLSNMLLRSVCRAGVINLGLFGFIVLKLAMTDAETAPSRGDSAEACDMPGLAVQLSQAESLGAGPLVIMAHPDLGADLLYLTPHSVVGSSYHRNVEGMRDSLRFLLTDDDQVARTIAERRAVDLVVACRNYAIIMSRSEEGTALYERLLSGAPPAWLRPLAPFDSEGSGQLLFQVVR